MIHYTKAVAMLAPYHNAGLVCKVDTENGFNAQLSTGHEDMPMISVSNSLVCLADVMEVIDLHTASEDNQVQEVLDYVPGSVIYRTPYQEQRFDTSFLTPSIN